MNLLDEIEKKLKEINPNTKYAKLYDFDDLTDYNFLVFGKKGLRKLPDGNSLQNSFFVIIVNENYIEDSTVLSVIDKVQEIPGLRLAAGDFSYEYLRKGKTDFVVETLMLEFSKTLKRGGGFEYKFCY